MGHPINTPRVLKKVVYAMTETKLEKNVNAHKSRGWKEVSEVKSYGYGLGVMMEFDPYNK